MQEEELIRKLENVDLSRIEVKSHRVWLRKALLQSKNYKEKPEPRFLSLAKLKMIVPLITHRPVWQKALAIFLIVVTILGLGSIILLGQDPTGQAVSWEVVANKAYAATMGVTSFHFDVSHIQTGWYEGRKVYEDPDWLWILEGDFLAPDRMQWTQWSQKNGQKLEEVRIIGDKEYDRDIQTGEWELQYFDQDGEGNVVQGLSGFIQPVSIAERLKILDDIAKLPDEVIDNVNCLHYRGKWDVSDEDYEDDTIVEFWISKDDYLLKQHSLTTSSKVMVKDIDKDYKDIPVPENATITITYTMILRYSSFNEPVEIVAPL